VAGRIGSTEGALSKLLGRLKNFKKPSRAHAATNTHRHDYVLDSASATFDKCVLFS
jgi:hypothetical protein